MAQVYCTTTEIENIIGPAAVKSCCDDDQSGGALSAGELLHITAAIERAAVEMNSSLDNQYILSELADSDWCKWCNAYIACWHLYSRRSNPPPNSIVEAVQDYRDKLSEARWGRFQVPEIVSSIEHRPTVSNFKPELYKTHSPIRVSVDESTGAQPNDSLKREISDQPGDL